MSIFGVFFMGYVLGCLSEDIEMNNRLGFLIR